MGSRAAQALLRGDRVAAVLLQAAAFFETKMPQTASRLWQYSIVILDKKQ
jgi:hypothetical protein